MIKKTLVLIILFATLSVPRGVHAASMATTLPAATVTTAVQDQFNRAEIPTIEMSSHSSISQNFTKFFNSLRGKSSTSVATLTNPQGETIIEQPIKSGTTDLTVPLEALTPGRYSLTIDDQPNLTFSWGVLSLNTDKDSYKVGETAYLQVASLSSTGHTLCDSNLKLTVNQRVVALQPSPTCGANNVTDAPDYFAYYPVTETGAHAIELTNLDNSYTLSDSFMVKANAPFTIERLGATRINPFKSDYTMTIKVTANNLGYSGEIKEQLPPGFTALSETSWVADLESGVEQTFTYTYRAPKVSPAVFHLGPVQIGTYQETRTWSLASDATFQMQTGYYIGDGVDNRAITGVGFQPQLIFIKDDTTNGTDGVIWKSSNMSGEISGLLGEAEAELATDAIQSLDSDGFTLGTYADVNAANVRFTWVAFRGSDCTSSGTFCVGSYTGTGSSQNITSVGFQPNMVLVKKTTGGTARAGCFRTSAMAANESNFFSASNTTSTAITTLNSNGFTVVSNTCANEASGSPTYQYVAFKTTAGAFDVGSFTGDGTSSKAITVGFQPQYVWIKNSNATSAVSAAFALTESGDDYSSKASDAANLTGVIKTLDANGFTVGSAADGNENTKTIYWFAFAGAASQNASGTYRMATGTYTGNGTTQSVTSIGFAPNLVIIKHVDQATDQYAVFRTSLMHGDRTHYFANSAANFAGGITSLDAGGFTLGSNATVNTSADTYYWTAFGNAYNPETGTGAADFTIGAYSGNNLDNRDIHRLPFQPNLITVKRDDTSSGGFRTSSMSGDLTGMFAASAEAADWIQAINSDGFEVGTAAQVAGSAALIHFFAFKSSGTFTVNSYTGSGSAQNITSPGFQPNLIWVKKATGGTARGGILRTSAQAGNAAQPFLNSPSATTHITGILSNGFSVGAGNLANENTFNYRYAAWMINVAPNTPSLDSPADTATNQSLTPALLTTATDTGSDYLRYKIELCTNVGMTTGCQTFDETSSQTGWSGQNAQTSTAYTSGTQATYTVQSALTAATTYYWRSYAIDPGGINTWSGTQTPRSFTTTTAPTAPTTPYAEGASNPTGIIDLTPEFSAIHNDPNADPAVYYEIEVNTANTFAGTVMWDTGATSMSSLADTVRSTDVSYAGTTLTYNGTTYYWRIRFTDNKGAVGAWSATQNFATNAPPVTPSLDAPIDTATGQLQYPLLKTTTTDAASDYIRYKIELCTNVGMTTGCQTFDQTSSQTGWSGQNAQTSTAYTSGTQATYTVQSALYPSTTYYWRSYGIDPGGTNTWSGTQTPYSFTTQAPIPVPESLECRVDESNDKTTFVVSWLDRSVNEDGYEIQRSLNGGAYSVLATGLAPNTITYSDSPITHGTQYRYRIAPYYNPGVNSATSWCETVTLLPNTSTFKIN